MSEKRLWRCSILLFIFLFISPLILFNNEEIEARRLPHGSYHQTCRDCSVHYDLLECECRKTNGRWQHTRIAFRDCQGDIWNRDGYLECKEKQERPRRPHGSYEGNCRNCSVHDGILECECRKITGRWQRTRIVFRHCQGDIWNRDGYLECKEKQERSRKPHGSYEGNCRNCSVHDGVLECDCRKINGKWQRTRIHLNTCGGSISNQNGLLTCD